MWLGVIIVLLLALIVWHVADMGHYTVRRGVDLTGGATHKDTTGFIRYLRGGGSQKDCRVACDDNEWCSAYTYTGSDCYGVAGRDETKTPGYVSGYKPVYKIDFAAGMRKTESLTTALSSPDDSAVTYALVRAPRSQGLGDMDNRIASSRREGMSSRSLSAADQRIMSSLPEFMTSSAYISAGDQLIDSGVK